MAFHIACPITCRRICDCELGFPAALRGEVARSAFLDEIDALEEFLRDPWTVRPADEEVEETVQVWVPRVAQVAAPPSAAVDDGGGGGGGGGGAGDEVKRALLQRQALAASLAAEDYVRRLEAGNGSEVLGEATSNHDGEDQGISTIKVMCRICFSGESEGSEKAMKMLSCKSCNKKYHKSCLKTLAEHRDLFHWSSWSCPSCRICEVCRRTGDPNKLMYCKRCDGAYHCYCQQPPHKNVSRGPYLCPKHTRCHSCGSTVPGSGLSTRWFLGYTCCDACGRLFVKGNYCPVCLKVYRDSEITPMVCCDACERWVHCMCDGISDEKYQQFQADQNLQYVCAACRGDCYQVKDIHDAVRELWKRKDIADSDLIASLRVAAGLPSQEETYSISPYSGDEQSGPIILKNDNSKPLKFSLKGISDKSAKDYGNISLNKKQAKKKGYRIKLVGKKEETYSNPERQNEARSLESSYRDQIIDEMTSSRPDGPDVLSSSTARSPNANGMKSIQLGNCEQNMVKDVERDNADTVPKVKIKSSKLQGLHFKECAGKSANKNDTARSTKLVIHIGSTNKNASSSPRSETSSCHKDQELAASFGAKMDNSNTKRSPEHGVKGKTIIKIGKFHEKHRKSNGNVTDARELNTTDMSVMRRNEITVAAENASTERSDKVLQKNQTADISVRSQRDSNEMLPSNFTSNSSKDPKTLLKLKFKNPCFEQKSSWAPNGEEENSVKGQRSKRKRPSNEKMGGWQDERLSKLHLENLIDEAMDANWILQKLGMDAIGKRVEVQSSDGSWHQGAVIDVNQDTSSLSVHLDNGRSALLELGKQGIRFISQKQRRAKT
ncbi:hypothetical protein OPV22_012529 [Ensete ventricosum]|uniref:PHD-type domain-containing protein n=1 Tax=Ensete ventricosum TaxID=4639 RepID=A0AAV8PHK6_ENSVE|nr:hypothetical protein OPV22_012529 [Ensete ventricosum]